MKFISIGCWCGPAMGMGSSRDEAYPFDFVRSTFEGVIDCINNDFINFFPSLCFMLSSGIIFSGKKLIKSRIKIIKGLAEK